MAMDTEASSLDWTLLSLRILMSCSSSTFSEVKLVAHPFSLFQFVDSYSLTRGCSLFTEHCHHRVKSLSLMFFRSYRCVLGY